LFGFALLLLATVAAVIWAIVKAGRLPAPLALITALTILSTLALFGFVATNAEPLATIAATGVGAIAGAVASVWRTEPDEKEQESKKED
jgi:hypothetical protein